MYEKRERDKEEERKRHTDSKEKSERDRETERLLSGKVLSSRRISTSPTAIAGRIVRNPLVRTSPEACRLRLRSALVFVCLLPLASRRPPPCVPQTPPTPSPATIYHQARAIEKQIQAARARDESRGQTAEAAAAGPTELRRGEGQSSFRIGLNARATTFVPGGGGSGSDLTTAAGSLDGPAKKPRLSGAFGAEEEEGGGGGGRQAGAAGGAGLKSNGKGKGGGGGGGKRSVMEVLMEQERAKKKAKEAEEKKAAEEEVKAKASGGGGGGGGRKDYWLRPGIVVKVMNKKVGGGKYYKKKARLRKVVERYVGEVKMLDSGDRLRVDQDDLETVRKRLEGRNPSHTIDTQSVGFCGGGVAG